MFKNLYLLFQNSKNVTFDYIQNNKTTTKNNQTYNKYKKIMANN